MSLTPVEIRHVRLRRRPLGYERPGVDRLLEEITSSFEDVWRERADLRDEVERLESELARARELETLLRNTLLSAERAADVMRAQARREAEVIVQEARVKARDVAGTAESERERVRAEIRRLKSVEADMRAGYRAFLLTALDRLERETEEREAPGQAA
jgi:cell division initiation protein